MKISIVTITYNSAKTLPDTLRSISEQTYPDIEHILIDGASTDETLSIIESYAASRDHVHYISEKDKGIYEAINKGIRRATGDVIGILNSDDVLANANVLATIAKVFTETDADVTYGDLTYFNEKGVVRYWKSNAFQPRHLKYGWMPAHPTFYCKRSVYEAVGLYDESFRISSDYDFMLRVLKRPYKVVYIPEILVNMRLGGVSNHNLRAMLSKSREDIYALQKNQVGCGWWTILVKNTRKIHQFVRRCSISR